MPVSNVVAQPLAPGSDANTCPGLAATAKPSSDAAAAATHRDFCIAFQTDTGADDLKSLKLELPAGVVGDPTATPTCDQATFTDGGGDCDGTNQVGTVSSRVDTGFPLGVQTITGEVYNLKASATQPAVLGIALDAGIGSLTPVYVRSAVRVRVADAGLDSVTIDDVPNAISILGVPVNISVQSMALTLWGTKTDHPSLGKPFVSLPTQCADAETTALAVTSYGGQVTSGSASFTPTQCDKVPFTPSLQVGPATAPADAPGEASAKLIIPTTDIGTGDNARRQAYLRNVDLKLPAGLALNPPLANGLEPCTPEQFGFGVDAPPQCPASSEMGRVEFVTPLFPGQTLAGKVYFGTPRPGVPLVNFISVEDPRLRLKLGGFATIDPNTTAITAHFTDQPQVPFESFNFIYTDPGNGRATLTSPTACGDYSVTADMSPWNGGAVASPTNSFKVVDCGPPTFAPTLGVSLPSAQAGGPAALTVRIGRPDKNLRLQDAKVSLPPGLTGRLPAVPACDVDAARANQCSDASLVGSAQIAVGTGPAPLSLPGKVYLTKGFGGGIAGLAVSVNTKVPALDLGTVVVMNKLVLRPDTGIDVQTEALPQTLQGIPTVYRSIDLTIDRKGFMQNATTCAAQQINGAFTAVGGAQATASAAYQASGCDKLPFAPKLSATVGATNQVAANSHPPLNVTIAQGDGQAAQKRTVVSLPAGIGVDLKNLSSVCTDAQLNAGACPAGSKIGTVTARTPLLPAPLSGGVYLTQGAKLGALPGLALDLGIIRLKGTVALGQRLVTTFDNIPDVPLTKLVLSLTGGAKAALKTSKSLCDQVPTVLAEYTGQNGATGKQTANATVIGCGSGLKAKGKLAGLAKKRPSLSLTVTSTKTLKGVRVKLPSTLKLASTRSLGKSSRVTLGGKRYKKTKVKWSSGKVSFTGAKGAKTRKLTLTLPRGVLKLKHAIKVHSKQTFTVYGLTTAGKLISVKVKLTAGR
ncbi:hypothetical protein DSM104299_00867 [Baekduia alba]|uniref:hypothetical protein n=1 Tax=Baekduia alba TaxID=2997333 RepID=UPI00233FDCFA|nr:hypothetical protein [Baekduia alba]WCB92178.1 hypothetical protein DSM104299_00867 [Baekduia alba]